MDFLLALPLIIRNRNKVAQVLRSVILLPKFTQNNIANISSMSKPACDNTTTIGVLTESKTMCIFLSDTLPLFCAPSLSLSLSHMKYYIIAHTTLYL
jgi:hypothetical protein